MISVWPSVTRCKQLVAFNALIQLPLTSAVNPTIPTTSHLQLFVPPAKPLLPIATGHGGLVLGAAGWQMIQGWIEAMDCTKVLR